MLKSVIIILIAFSFAHAYEVCSVQGGIQYYCEDGYGCCSDTTCGLNCSGGGGGGFPWYGYVLIGVGVVLIIALLKVCPKLCRQHKQKRQQQQQQQLLQA